MPPAAKCNRCVIIYDLKSKNQRELRSALLKVYCKYYFSKNSHRVNLLLVNSEETSNEKHARHGNKYEHILLVNKEPLQFDPTYIFEKLEIEDAEGASWKEAIRVAIQILQEDQTKRVITYQILFFTDLSCSVSSKECLNEIAFDLRSLGIFLYIVGPAVQFPRTLTSFDEIRDIMCYISFKNVNDNLVEAQKLMKDCKNVVIADVKEGLQLFCNYTNNFGKQPWMVPLSFGSKIQFQVETAKLMQKRKGFRLKSEFSRFSKTPSVFVSAEDSTKVYCDDDILKGISRHGKFIPLKDNDMFKTVTDRTFSLMFIAELKHVPEYMMKGPESYLVTEAKNKSPEAFHCLLSRLEHKKCCLVVKRVYNKGNRPMFMALIPNIEKLCFTAVALPYAHEVPFEWMEEDPQKNPNEVPEDVTAYLESITINSPEFKLSCTMTPNVICYNGDNKILNIGIKQLLKEKINFEKVDYDVFATGMNSEIGQKLRESWPSRAPSKIEVDVGDANLDSDYDDAYF